MSEMYKMIRETGEMASMRSYLNLKAPQFATQFKSDKKGVLLDVRSHLEYATYSVPGAKHILSTDSEKLRNLNRKKNYYVHSNIGHRSTRVSRLLTSEGFRVINLDDRVENLMEQMDQ